MSLKTLSETLGRASPGATGAATFIFALAAAALLAAPGQTVIARYLNDLFVFLDGAHRIVSGQVPHRDYHTPIGALADLLPAIGLYLTGSLGRAMPTGFAVLILLLAPVIAHILGTRLRLALALPMALYLVFILAAPANLGEDARVVSFGMFYNRICWVALALLFVMFLRPHGHLRPVRDALCAAGLALLMVYLKISYGAVALAFLVLMLTDREQRRWATGALAATVAATVVLEALWSLPSAYFADLHRAASSGGAVQGGPERLLVNLQENLVDYAAFAVAAAAALFIVRDLRTVAFLVYCALAGLLIQNQNFQVTGIVALAAGAAVAVEAMARRLTWEQARWRLPFAAASIALLLLVVPMIAGRSVALGTHAWLASTRPAHRFALPRLDRIVLAESGSHHDARYTAQYLEIVEDGARALSALEPRPVQVSVFDFVNPFSAGLGLPPARGDNSVNQFGRTFDKQHFVPAEIALGHVQVLLEPTQWRLDPPTADAFRELYADYIAEHFVLARETAFWKIHSRRDGAPTTASTARGAATR
jgi:hypothetical protein